MAKSVTMSCAKSAFHKNPTMNSSGSFTVTRETEQTTKVHIKGSVTITVPDSTYYRVPPSFGAQVGNYSGMSVQMVSPQDSTDRLPYKEVTTYAIYDSAGHWGYITRDGKGWHHTPSPSNKYPMGGSFTISYDQDLEWKTGDLVLYALCVWKVSNTESDWVNGNCDQGYHKVNIGSLSINDLPYSDYTPFSNITFSSITPIIGRYNDTNFKVKYSITGGTKNLTSVKARLYDMGGNLRANYDLGTSKGTNMEKTFKVNAPANATGWHYKVNIYATDGKTEKSSGNKEIYTYVMPTLTNLKLSATGLKDNERFSPQDAAKVTYSTNGRKWTFSGGEANFTTKRTLNGKTANASSQAPTNNTNEKDVSDDNIVESLASSVIYNNDIFSKNDRSVAVMNSSITITRINTSAGTDGNGNYYYTASQTKNFKVQFQPTNTPGGGDVKDPSGNNVKNTTIYTNTIGTISVDWTYNSTSGAAGVVNGYKIEVFKSNSYTDANKIGTYYTADTTISLNTKTQLQRGVMNYIRITPYYFKPNQTGSVIDDTKIILGEKSYTGALVKPIYRLNPPTIDYPIDNTTWHNNYFRILLRLPEDDDVTALVNDGTITSASAYKYNNIQIRVTPSGKSAVTYSITGQPTIFSRALNDIPYTVAGRKIAICPALQSVDSTVSSYKVEVRVQKKYYNLTDAQSWSEWAEVNIKRTPISNLNLSVGQEIKLAHYMGIRNASVSSYNVYPIVANALNGNVERKVGDKILYNDYKEIYETIVAIKTGVNGYCTYDNTDVSFTRDISDLETNPPKQEYITAAKTSTNPSGRNYMNILIDDLNKLY